MEDAFSKGKLRAAIQRILRVTESNFSGVFSTLFFILLCFLVSTPIFGCCFQSIHGNGIFTRFVFVRRQYLIVLLFWQPISDNDIFKAYLFSHQWLKNTQLSTPCHLRLFFHSKSVRKWWGKKVELYYQVTLPYFIFKKACSFSNKDSNVGKHFQKNI